jgi:hypothetical protein
MESGLAGKLPWLRRQQEGYWVIGQQKMSGQAAGEELGSAGQLMAGQVCREAAVQL